MALERMLYDDNTASQTFELYGPKQYSTAEIAELVNREIVRKRRSINVPKFLLKPAAYYLNKLLWWPTLSADQVEREFIDQRIDPSAKTFKDLGIEPVDISTLTFHYLVGDDPQSIRRGTDNCKARIPTLAVLRPAPGNGAGASGGEEVPARAGRPVSKWDRESVNTTRLALDCVSLRFKCSN